jgi:hypothetical protein
MKDPTKPLAHNLILHCQICGNAVGSAYAPNMTEEEYRIKTGIVDQRCSTCETDHGTFRELLDAFTRETGDGEDNAEKFVVKHRKREDFDKALLTEKRKREKEKDAIIK